LTRRFVYASENERRRVGIQGIPRARELPRPECLPRGFVKSRDASASRTCILALRKRDLAAPTVMFNTHAVSAVLRFLTSCRNRTSRHFTERASIARRSVSPSSFLLRAAEAISRQSVKVFPWRRICGRSVAIAAKTFSKLAALTGSVFVLILVR
jgi:hypothetical protein